MDMIERSGRRIGAMGKLKEEEEKSKLRVKNGEREKEKTGRGMEACFGCQK